MLRTTTLRVACVLAAFAFAGLRFAPPASADVIVLTDDRILNGEVVEETRRTVKFRCRINNVWTTLSLSRGQVVSIDRVDGDQADLAQRPAPERPAGRGPAPRTEAPAPGGRIVAVIPLHGRVGGLVGEAASGTFDATVLEECLTVAEKEGAELVVLDVQSPGGLVSEMEAICETIIAWHDRMRIVAFAGEAYRAAAIISLSCRELAMRPDGRIGAAVIIRGDQRGGISAVDAKFASPHYAKQRQYMAASGKPYEVVAAMTIQDKVLWWAPQKGFAPSAPTETGWVELDGRTTVLTLTAEEAEQYDVADVLATDAGELARALGIEGAVSIVEYDDRVERYNKAYDRQIERLQKQFYNYFTGLGEIVAGLNAYAEASKRGDRREAERVKAKANRARGKVLAAGRMIRRSDKSLLARRIKVPGAAIARIEADAVLLGKVQRLLAGDTIEGFNEVAERVNKVIGEWQKLLAD